MIPGDGIGPEISSSVQKIFGAAGVRNFMLIVDTKK
jgi:isocitrate/isopropylmalate dehydrogenase